MNWDLLSQNNPKAILEAISSRKPVLTEAYMLPNMSDSDQVAEFEAWKEWFRNFIHPGDVSLHTGALDFFQAQTPKRCLSD
jgi:hypothetical protein